MWAPWRVALVAGIVAGIVSLVPPLSPDALYVTLSTAAISIQVFFATWLGAWASRRSLLPKRIALVFVAGVAALVLLVSVPIETYSVVVNLTDAEGPVGSQKVWILRAYLLAAAVLVVPALASFTLCRACGSPPNTSLERTRER